ncbi:hypothetical protein CSC33_2014 [Pseudomonas aeruginosa]|nr:hypothetical protein CSC33_2014 [Pseudomonas aeruginosa]
MTPVAGWTAAARYDARRSASASFAGRMLRSRGTAQAAGRCPPTRRECLS